MLLFLATACYQLDGFFFNPTVVDAYTLGGDIVPADCQEMVSFDGEAGTLYGAWVHQPQAADESCEPGGRNEDVPVVVFFHGNADNLDGYWNHLEFYWQSGYEVFEFDYRGYGRSVGDPSFDGVIADGATAIAYVEDTTDLPSTDLVFIGESLGGFVVVHNLTDTPPKALITEDMFANTQKMLDDGTDLDLPSGWFFVDNFDNVPAVHNMPPEVPYLVAHGTADDYIEPEHAEMVYKAAGATAKHLLMVEGANHNTMLETDPDTVRTWVECWITQTCPTEE